METLDKKPSLSVLEKASVSWLALFTIGAIAAQIYLIAGGGIIASPEHALLPPFISLNHILGTDHLGRDVFFYLFISCRTAWLLTIPPLLVASLLGVLAGTGAGFLGNKGLKIPYLRLSGILILLLVYLYLFSLTTIPDHYFPLWIFQFCFFSSGLVLLYYILTIKLPAALQAKGMSVPLDKFLLKVMDVWTTLPKLLLLLVLTTFSSFSLITFTFWICITFWVYPARLTRAIVIQHKSEAYFEAAHTLGIPLRIIVVNFFWSALKGPLITNFCFVASGLLGVGSTMAYLGIGIPADVPSWGKMLSNARYSFESWWLFLFPMLFLVLSILSLQALGSKFSMGKRTTIVTNS